MKDPYLVLRQKEKELERVRVELKALLIAAALLAEGGSTESAREAVPLAPALLQEFRGNELEDLAVYYPFIKRPQKSQK